MTVSGSGGCDPIGGPLERSSPVPLYEQVADRVGHLIEEGVLRTGQKIPSVRRLSSQLTVSVTTVLEAYRTLEDRGLVEAKPQSGYYVRPRAPSLPLPEKSESCETAAQLRMAELILRVRREANRADLLPLGAATPAGELLPAARLNRLLAQEVRRHPEASCAYDALAGHEELRVQIARRALDAGCVLTPEDVITTCGAQDAVRLCLQAVTRPGDTVAIESPTFYGLLEVLESLHLRGLEIATCPEDGICLVELEEALRRHEVAACALCPSFGNPLGHLMPEAKKREVVALLSRWEVPLIEDDVYGDLPHEGERPRAAKAFDKEGGVMLCSSFSKTIAPGYRVGWTAAGRYRDAVERFKFNSMVAAPSPTQMAVAAFLARGGYDRHLRGLRRTCRDLVARMTEAVAESFPPDTRVSRPRGGHVLWVELPEKVDSLRLYEDAVTAGMGLAPGPIFSATGRYRNFLRLNCAVPWTDEVERCVETLGDLARRHAEASSPAA